MIKIFVLFFPLSVAPPSRFSWVVRNVLKGAMWGLLGYACFRASKGVGRALLSLPTVQSLYENIRTPSVWPFSKRHRLFSSEIRMSHWTPVALTTGWWWGRLGGRLKADIISISYEISSMGGSLRQAQSPPQPSVYLWTQSCTAKEIGPCFLSLSSFLKYDPLGN